MDRDARGRSLRALEQPELLLADMRRVFASRSVSDDAPKRSIMLRSVGGLALLVPMTQPPEATPASVANAIEGNLGARILFANLLGTPISHAAYGLRWGRIFAPAPVAADAATRGGGGLRNHPVSVNARLVSRHAELTIQ